MQNYYNTIAHQGGRQRWFDKTRDEIVIKFSQVVEYSIYIVFQYINGSIK